MLSGGWKSSGSSRSAFSPGALVKSFPWCWGKDELSREALSTYLVFLLYHSQISSSNPKLNIHHSIKRDEISWLTLWQNGLGLLLKRRWRTFEAAARGWGRRGGGGWGRDHCWVRLVLHGHGSGKLHSCKKISIDIHNWTLSLTIEVRVNNVACRNYLRSTEQHNFSVFSNEDTVMQLCISLLFGGYYFSLRCDTCIFVACIFYVRRGNFQVHETKMKLYYLSTMKRFSAFCRLWCKYSASNFFHLKPLHKSSGKKGLFSKASAYVCFLTSEVRNHRWKDEG